MVKIGDVIPSYIYESPEIRDASGNVITPKRTYSIGEPSINKSIIGQDKLVGFGEGEKKNFPLPSAFSSVNGEKKANDILKDTNGTQSLSPISETSITERPSPLPPSEQIIKDEYAKSKTDEEKRVETENQRLKTALEPIKTNLKSSQLNQISAIESQFASLRKEQEEVNRSRLAVETAMGFRRGGQYAPGMMSAQTTNIINEGLQKIEDLNAKEREAKYKVNDAFDQKMIEVGFKEYEALKDIRLQQDKAVQKLDEDMRTQLKETRKELTKLSQEKSLATILSNELEDGIFNRETFLQKAAGIAPIESVKTFLDALQEKTQATSADYNDLFAILGKRPTLQQIVDYKQAKLAPQVKEYTKRNEIDGKIHLYRDILDSEKNVIATTDLGETGSSILDELRQISLQQKTGVAEGQLVSASTNLPVSEGNQAMKDRVINLKGLLEQVDYISEKVNQGIKTNAIRGWITYKGVAVPALQETLDPTLIQLQAEMIGLFTRYVYAMTGAQVNELEFERATKMSPSIQSTPENNKAIIKGFKSNMQNQVDTILKGEGWKFAGGESNKQSNEKIDIILPDGTPARVPKENLQKAIDRGAKLK